MAPVEVTQALVEQALAFFLPNNECLELKQPVSKMASILVGEMLAIKITLQAVLDEVKKRDIRDLHILSDSQTAIGTLTLGWDCKNHSSLLLETKLLWNQLRGEGVDIKLDWTPGHANIEGNERADKLAKEAALGAERMDKDASQPVSQTDVKDAAKKMALLKWQRRWDLSEKGRQLHELKQNVGKKELDFKHCTYQKTLLQLQNGHCKVKDHLYRVGLSESAGCECGMAKTIEHLLLDCTLYAAAREKMTSNISLGTDLARNQITAHVLLRSDETETQKVFRPTINKELDDFLISTNRFKDVTSY